MATELKRMTFAVTPDMEKLMDEAKQMFYDRTQSDMIRTLVVAGLTALKEEKATKGKECDRAS
jgi:hypothetical protein